MKKTFRVSPNYRQAQSTKNIMMQLGFGLLAVFAFSLFYYFTEYGTDFGLKIIGLMAVSLVVSYMSEGLFAWMTKRNVKEHFNASFPYITPMILTLTCTVSTTYYAVAVSTIFAVVVAKLLFGGFGQNIFNPAAVGRAVIFASFAGSVSVDLVTSATPVTEIASKGWLLTSQTSIDALLSQFGGLSNLFIGMYPGAIGETSSLVILVVGIYLAIRKVIDWKVPVVYIASIFVFTYTIAMVHDVGLWYPMYHILTGGVMFGAVFMLTDPVTNPTSSSGRIVFAVGAATLTVLIRIAANLPEGVVFSILIMNMLTPLIERMMDGVQIKRDKIYFGIFVAIAFLGFSFTMLTGTLLEEVDQSVDSSEDTILFDKKVAMNDASVDLYSTEILEVISEGPVKTYLVSVAGYGMVNSDHPDKYNPNQVEVIVNVDERKIVAVDMKVFSDTVGIGDLVVNEDYYEVFKGLSIDDLSVEVDTVNSATFTSKSFISAVVAAINAANE